MTCAASTSSRTRGANRLAAVEPRGAHHGWCVRVDRTRTRVSRARVRTNGERSDEHARAFVFDVGEDAVESPSFTERLSKVINAKTLFACFVGLVLLGSLLQRSSLSSIVLRLVSIALVRFIFRRAYRVLCACCSFLYAEFAHLPKAEGIGNAAKMKAKSAWRRTGEVVRATSIKTAAKSAWSKFNADRRGMLLIPVVAAFVGWFTNWLAVKMIFYPINFLGIPLMQYVEGSTYGFDVLQPLGLFGWQGIVPAKAAQMSESIVTMVTTKLVNVQDVFMLLSPTEVSSLLLNEVPDMASKLARDMVPYEWAVSLAERAVPSLPAPMLAEVGDVVSSYLSGFVVMLQQQVDKVIDLKELVVTAMCTDRVVLVDLFRKCGANELEFLVNSGLFFGFLLGVIQMVVWAFYDNPWSITIGGAVVGLLTNWLALKFIFEPVEPVFVGPFKFQGLFLQRQHEVSGTFSDYLTSKVLQSEKIWDNMLYGAKGEEFNAMLEEYTKTFIVEEAARRGLSTADLDCEVIGEIAKRVVDELPGRGDFGLGSLVGRHQADHHRVTAHASRWLGRNTVLQQKRDDGAIKPVFRGIFSAALRAFTRSNRAFRTGHNPGARVRGDERPSPCEWQATREVPTQAAPPQGEEGGEMSRKRTAMLRSKRRLLGHGAVRIRSRPVPGSGSGNGVWVFRRRFTLWG